MLHKDKEAPPKEIGLGLNPILLGMSLEMLTSKDMGTSIAAYFPLKAIGFCILEGNFFEETFILTYFIEIRGLIGSLFGDEAQG